MAQLEVFLAGHGGWTPNDGYTELPKGCSFKFFTQNAKLMLGTDVFKIIENPGTYMDTDTEVAEYKNVQNMTLYPDDAGYLLQNDASEKKAQASGRKVYVFYTQRAGIKKGGSMKLANIIPMIQKAALDAGYTGCDFNWVCCRDLSLNATAKPKTLANGVVLPGTDLARDSGINAGETVGKYMTFDKSTWQLGASTLKIQPIL